MDSISGGGEVCNVDNLWIKTPRKHIGIYRESPHEKEHL
ncbi:hypothetical protein [Pseudomonas sp. RA_15y_Pfl1_P12]